MIEKKDIEKLAQLSRIQATDEECGQIEAEIKDILGYVSEIQKVASEDEGVNIGPIHNVMREDGEPHVEGLYTKVLINEAPQKEGEYIKVKKIITQD